MGRGSVEPKRKKAKGSKGVADGQRPQAQPDVVVKYKDAVVTWKPEATKPVRPRRGTEQVGDILRPEELAPFVAALDPDQRPVFAAASLRACARASCVDFRSPMWT